MKHRLVAAANAVVPAYLALVRKGYSVRCETTPEGEESWSAENETCLFLAEDPVALLGVVGVYETRGEDWSASDAEIDAFFERFGDPGA